MDLDRLDLAILDELQQHNRVTYDALGERVGLSPSSCRRRITALRRAGVIVADVAVVSPAKVGLPVVLFALVTLDRDGGDAHAAFRERMQQTPAVVARTYVTGPADYLVKIAVRDMEQYEALLTAVLGEAPVRRVETMVTLRETKPNGRLPCTPGRPRP